MKCEERSRLWDAYNEALELFTALADELDKPFTPATFAPRMLAAKSAGADCKSARVAWEQHIQAHGCSD